MFQVIVVLLSCQLFDFNYLSLSNIFNFIKCLYPLCLIVSSVFQAPDPAMVSRTARTLEGQMKPQVKLQAQVIVSSVFQVPDAAMVEDSS